MRLVDTLFRRGHLSDQALVDAWQSGQRPAHLEACDLCLDRIVGMTRWLDDVRRAAVDEADAAFPQERLAAQHAQIFRRLEHLDRPARLIAFPGAARAAGHDTNASAHWRRWAVAAAAACFVIGVVTDHVTVSLAERANNHALALARAAAVTTGDRTAQEATTGEDLFLMDFEKPNIDAMGYLENQTPHASTTVASVGR